MNSRLSAARGGVTVAWIVTCVLLQSVQPRLMAQILLSAKPDLSKPSVTLSWSAPDMELEVAYNIIGPFYSMRPRAEIQLNEMNELSW